MPLAGNVTQDAAYNGPYQGGLMPATRTAPIPGMPGSTVSSPLNAPTLAPGYTMPAGTGMGSSATLGPNGTFTPNAPTANTGTLTTNYAGNPYAYFQSLIKNLPPSPASLQQIAPQLAQQGIKVISGDKVQLPDGTIMDTLLGSDGPNPQWQWLNTSGAQSGTLGSLFGDPQLSAAWTQPFSQTFTPPPQVDLGGPAGVAYQPPAPQFSFTPPTMAQAATDPGYQFRLQQGLNAIQNSAAAKGVLNTGGTLTDINNYAQDAASQEYQNLYSRMFGLAQQQFQPVLQGYQNLSAAGANQNTLNYQNAWNQYMQAYDAYRNFGNDTANRAISAAQLS